MVSMLFSILRGQNSDVLLDCNLGEIWIGEFRTINVMKRKSARPFFARHGRKVILGFQRDIEVAFN